MSAPQVDGVVGRIAPANLQQHPLSAAFPQMPDDDFQHLKDSIENIGIQNSIVLFEGKVIDGWHRYRAAKETISPCPCVDLADDTDPRHFVFAQNKHRRHLSQGQIALASASVYAWYPSGANKAAKCGTGAPGAPVEKTVSELAEIAGVSERTMQQAKAVQSSAAPEVQAAVLAGTVSLKRAAASCKPPSASKKIAKPDPALAIEPVGQSDLEELRERCNDMATRLMEATADNESMGCVFDADDKLAAATAEIKRLTTLLGVIESRLIGQTNELNEAKRLAQQWKRRAERAGAAHPKEDA